ncbi:MAG TPA: ATP synthase F1 subunit gamma [Thermoanaerobaculia bacterium]|nr:ATP synthase F1 subunit gamma [Thermoanaerobaculia bacterium]
MASLIDLRRRLRSVKNIQQITRAMKMVAAARLRRSQDRILAARPYAIELRRVVANLGRTSSGEALHPLLERREERKVLVCPVTGDKGLCGAFNSNVLRRSDQLVRELVVERELELLPLGRRGADYYARRKASIRAAHRGLFANVTYEAAAEIAQTVVGEFISGEYDAVYVVYNQFVSVMTQKLTVERVLPVEPEAPAEAGKQADTAPDWIFEPSVEQILDLLLPRFIAFQFYRVLLESQAAEHAARMTAMDAATRNARELIDRLTLTYNRGRQAAITKELIEVVSGAAALRG